MELIKWLWGALVGRSKDARDDFRALTEQMQKHMRRLEHDNTTLRDSVLAMERRVNEALLEIERLKEENRKCHQERAELAMRVEKLENGHA